LGAHAGASTEPHCSLAGAIEIRCQVVRVCNLPLERAILTIALKSHGRSLGESRFFIATGQDLQKFVTPNEHHTTQGKGARYDDQR
jgi:hypothetical protein